MIIEKPVCVKALAEAGLVYQLREALLKVAQLVW